MESGSGGPTWAASRSRRCDASGRYQYATSLSLKEWLGETVEHPSPRSSLGVDNAIVELNHPECPSWTQRCAFIYPGSRSWSEAACGSKSFLKVVRPIALSRGDKRIALYPSDHFKVTYSISFDHPMLRHQTRTMQISEESFIEEIAPARTFGFLKEVEMLRQNGLALGGSLENAIVLGETGALNALASKTSSSATRFSTLLATSRWSAIPSSATLSRTEAATPCIRPLPAAFSKKPTHGGWSKGSSTRRAWAPPCRFRLRAPPGSRISTQERRLTSWHRVQPGAKLDPSYPSKCH